MPRFRRARHTFRTATTVSAARPAYAAGMRASLATVVPLAIGHYLGYAGAATWMSFGGFNGALSDRGGSYKARAQTMSALLVTGAIAAALGTIAQGHLLPQLIVTFLVAFVCCLLRVWGNPGISVGGASLTVYVVALAIPAERSAEIGVRAGYVILGGLWAMAIALIVWPLRPYRPARLAISTVYSALATYVEHVVASVQVQQTTEWPVSTSSTPITSVRTALEEAGAVLVQLRRGRPGKVDRGERLLILAESADQIFAHVVALGETLRGAVRNDVLHEESLGLMRGLVVTAQAIASSVVLENAPARVDVAWSGESLRAIMRTMPSASVDPHYEQAAVIFDRAAQFASAASVTLEVLNGGQSDTKGVAAAPPVRAPASEEVPEEHAIWDMIRALLSPGSLIVAFALRVAVVTTIAVAVTNVLDLKRGYWLTITAIVILQPYAGVTLTRAVQRVLGTVLGALIAAALGAYFHDPRAILVMATVFVACCVALLPVNYAAFSVFLTPTFVLLAEASAGDWSLAETRVLNTLLGGALALAGARFLWPSPERTRFPAYGATAIRANAAYLGVVIDRFDDRDAPSSDAMRAARRVVGLATVNAEESLQRALTEAHGDERPLAPALTCLAYTRRFTASVAALAIARHADDGTTRATLLPVKERLLPLLDDLASALEAVRVPADLPRIDVTLTQAPMSLIVKARVDRLARQAKTLHDAVARMAPRED
ncbi:MAG: FUSC family protein [Gemmatimonadaceae bacterium]